MRNRVLIGCLLAAGVCLGGAIGRAQPTTQPAGETPKLAPVRTERSPGANQPPPASQGAGQPAGQPATGPAGQAQRAPQRDGGLGGMWVYVVLLGGFLLLWVWMGRSRRRQEAKRKEMLSALKKGDRVVTIGGVMGTVLETKGDEVTVKVDENNNVRMKFARWAIRGIGEQAKQEEEKK